MNYYPAYSLLLLGVTVLSFFMAIQIEAKKAAGGGVNIGWSQAL